MAYHRAKGNSCQGVVVDSNEIQEKANSKAEEWEQGCSE